MAVSKRLKKYFESLFSKYVTQVFRDSNSLGFINMSGIEPPETSNLIVELPSNTCWTRSQVSPAKRLGFNVRLRSGDHSL